MKKFNMRKGRQGQQYCTVRESTAKGREGPDRDHWYVGTPDALVSKLERAAHLEQVVPELEARVAKAEALAAKEKERAAGLLDATRIVAEAMIKLSVGFENGVKPIISVNEPTEEVAEVLAALGYYWAKGTLLKCGTPPPMVWGWTRGRGRPPGSRNKPKVAPPNAQV